MNSNSGGGSGTMSPSSSSVNRGNKQKRIEKELLQLRNLPKEIKLGKRETGLGILLYVRNHTHSIIHPCLHTA